MGPVERRASSSPIAHEWRLSTSRAEIARRRMASLQSAPSLGISISATTSSTIPSRIAVLVGDVFVERHRFDAELGAQAAHREGVESLSIGQVDGGLQDPLFGQRSAGMGCLVEYYG